MNILIIEDESIVALDIATCLELQGYTIDGIMSTGAEALKQVQKKQPDLIVMDINLKGGLDGIQTIDQIQKIANIPFIYLTALSDAATLQRAKHTLPFAYIVKPFKEIDLNVAIELALYKATNPTNVQKPTENNLFCLNDRIFIKNGNSSFEKIMLHDLYYLEANRVYCDIYTKAKKYTISTSLNHILEKQPSPYIARIHKSYAVNLTNIESIANNCVLIAGTELPIGLNYRNVIYQSVSFLR